MRQFLLLTLFIGLIMPAYSQNYQTVNSSEVKLLKGNDSVIRGYRIDSLKIQDGDTLLYPSRTIQYIGDQPVQAFECYDVEGSSMFGDYVRIMPNGTNLFFNQNGDTIRLETQAQAGDTWEIWSGIDWLDNEFAIYGEMLETELQDIFGVADSVRSIRLNAYDNEMNLVESFQFNDYLISISKNYGLLTAFNFYAFPNLREDYFGYFTRHYTLYGIESQGLGKSNLTTFGIFDFQPGDIIHYERMQMYTGNGFKQQVKEEYTSRVEYNGDSIIYGVNVDIKMFNHSNNGADISISFSNYQTTRRIIPLSYLDKLPGLPHGIFTEPQPQYYSIVMAEGAFTEKRDLQMAQPGGTLYYDEYQDCYVQGIDGLCGAGEPNIYRRGLGGPYYNCDWYVDLNHKTLVYFLKDSAEWGTPLDFTVSLTDIQNQVSFDVFPNPATDKVNVKLYDAILPSSVEIVDISGRTVFTKSVDAAVTQLDISQLQSGIYFVRIPFSGNKSVRKLIVQ